MISALLLPLLFSGSPANVAASQDDPPIRIWISNDRRFVPGDGAKVQVRTEYDGYLVVLHVDPQGRLRVLFPLDPDKDNFVRGHKKYEVRGRGGREAFEADDAGRGTIYAAVSRDPFRFDEFIIADHWDYRALAPARLQEDSEPELNDLVRRMAQGSYDYDLLTYDVFSRSYASSTSRYYGSFYNDDWCRFSCGRPYFGHSPFGLSIGFYYGRPYRRYYYDPYFYAYDPFYNPFFYDPYYYAPAYYPRYAYPRHYYGYTRPYYHDRYRTVVRPYTPYRFRGSDGFAAGYRDRRQDIRQSVNTVYQRPLSPVREPAASSPVRRVTSGDAAELPSGLAPRRSVGYESRVQPKAVEARRAREAEPARRVEPRDDRSTSAPSREAAPARREAEPRRAEPRRAEPRAEPRAQPQRREAQRGSSPPPQVRSSGRAEGRASAEGGRSAGAARPSSSAGSARPSSSSGGGGRRR